MSAPSNQHPATVARLETITDHEARLETSARIADEALEALRVPPVGGMSLIDRRNHLFAALHLLFSVPQSQIADRAGLDRRMIVNALEKQPTDMSALPSLPRLSEAEAVEAVKDQSRTMKAALRAAEAAESPKTAAAAKRAYEVADRRRVAAIRVLYFMYGESGESGDAAKSKWTRARIANKLRVGHPAVAEAIDPILRKMFGFGDIDQETAEREAFSLAARVRELQEIHLTASRICQETGTAMMAGEYGHVYPNTRIIDITGLKPSTVSQWRTGKSNEWKRENRRKAAKVA